MMIVSVALWHGEQAIDSLQLLQLLTTCTTISHQQKQSIVVR